MNIFQASKECSISIFLIDIYHLALAAGDPLETVINEKTEEEKVDRNIIIDPFKPSTGPYDPSPPIQLRC